MARLSLASVLHSTSSVVTGQTRWEHFDHEADIGVRGHGPTPQVAFEQAAVALTAVVTDPTAVHEKESVEISCEAPTLELLFVDWLNEIVFEMATRSMLFGRFEVSMDDTALKWRAFGERVDRERHCPAVEPKGATMTDLRVSNDAGEWIAQCVVDV